MKARSLRTKTGSALAEMPIGIGLVLFGAIIAVLLLFDTTLILFSKQELAAAASRTASYAAGHSSEDVSLGTVSQWRGWGGAGALVSPILANMRDNAALEKSTAVSAMGLPASTLMTLAPNILDTDSSGNYLRTMKVQLSANMLLIRTNSSLIPNAATMQETGAAVLGIDKVPQAFALINAPQTNLPPLSTWFQPNPPTFNGSYTVAVRAYKSGTISWYPPYSAPTTTTANCSGTVAHTVVAPVGNWMFLSPVN
jgi:hypothetical protein